VTQSQSTPRLPLEGLLDVVKVMPITLAKQAPKREKYEGFLLGSLEENIV
jgi:hypothetical protein